MSTQPQDLTPHGLRRWLPILEWLPRYDRSWLRGDVIAGLTVVALVVPEGMAYASLALVIAIKQVPKLFGLEAGEGNFWQRIVDLVTHLPETHLLTLAVGAGTLILMLFLEHRFHRFPAALAALVFGIGVSALFGLEALGVHVVGAIPAGLAMPHLPDVTVQQLARLIPNLGAPKVG